MQNSTLSPQDAVLLSEATQKKVLSEKLMLRAKDNAYRNVGIGVVLAVLGACTGGGFFAYSFINKKDAHVDHIAAAIKSALSTTTVALNPIGAITVEGSVALEDNQTVRLKDNGTVTLTQSRPFQVTGTVSIDIPNPPDPKNKPKKTVIQNLIVFKTTPFTDGSVLTGWKFEKSNQTKPSSQYCYYQKQSEHTETLENQTLGNDGIPSKPRNEMSFEEAAAFDKCVWFKI